jgi:hypothetical protein
MKWETWKPYVLGLIAAVVIGQFWHLPFIVSISIWFIVLIWIVAHFVGQMNGRLDRIEAELSKKSGASQPGSGGDIDGGGRA